MMPERISTTTTQKSGSQSSERRRIDLIFAYAILALLPVLLLLTGPNWIVSSLFNDPWIYFGYYLDLPTHLRVFNGLYYGNRLSTILPGWLAYKLFHPISADLVLHLGLYYSGLFAFHEMLGRTVSRRGALLASILLGSNFFYLNAVGHDYVDGFGVVYSILAMLSLLLAAGSTHWRFFLFCSGVFTAAMIVAFFSFAIMVPFFIILYLMANQARSKHSLISSGVWWLGGAASLLLAFCVINWMLTGQFWFLSASFKFIRDMATSPNRFVDHSRSWLPYAVWLATPLLASLASLNHLRGSVGIDRALSLRLSTYFPIQLIAILGIFVTHDLRGGASLLQPWYYASQLLPATFLAMGSLFAETVRSMPARRYILLVFFALCAGLVPTALIGRGYSFELPGIPPLIWIVPLCLAATAALTGHSIRSDRLKLFLLLYGTIQFLAISGFKQENSMITLQKDPDFVRREYLSRPPRNIKPYGERIRAYDRLGFDVLRAMVSGVRQVQEVDPSAQTMFWFNLEEPNGVFFNNLACTYTWGVRILNLDFPQLNDARTIDHAPVIPGMKVVILSSLPDVYQAARRELHGSALDGKILAVRKVEEGAICYWMTFLEITKPKATPSNSLQ